MSALGRLTLLAIVPLLSAACGRSEVSTPTMPTITAPIIETLTGRVTVNGAQTHFFEATQSGSILAVLGDISPDGTIIGFQMGTANGILCTAVQSVDEAEEGTRIVLAASAAGSLCVRVYDTGSLTGPANYAIYLEHP